MSSQRRTSDDKMVDFRRSMASAVDAKPSASIIRAMRLLVLGGTGFLGRAIVRSGLDRGWTVTTFNRGLTGQDVSGVVALRGDRGELRSVELLAEANTWDAVLDCSGYVPRNVLAVSSLLAPRVDRYIFVSSVSAYADWPASPLTEESPLLECPPDAGPEFGVDIEDGPTRYGYQKAGCEAAVRVSLGSDRTTVLRPGVVLGPREYVGRLVWWLQRIARGGTVAAPGLPDRFVQPIDVRDVADFAVDCASNALTGEYNLTAPLMDSTFGELLRACVETTESHAALHWLSDDFLLAHGVRQWSEMPLWRVQRGVWSVDPHRAVSSGLRTRPLVQTVRDTWSWLQSGDHVDGRDRAFEIGLDAEKESELLAAAALQGSVA